MGKHIGLLLLLVLLVSCGTVQENRAPVLETVLNNFSISRGQSFTLTLEHVKAYDEDGDVITVKILDESNLPDYTISGSTITPAINFVGAISVAISIFDGELYSRTDTFTLSVVNELVLHPLYKGSQWEYIDSVTSDDTALVSVMAVQNSIDSVISGETVSVADVVWSDLFDEYGIVYRMGNSVAGMNLYSAYSPTDTIEISQQQYPNPVALGDSWQYVELQYDASDSEFIFEDTMMMTCTGVDVYVTVPAGTFKCTEFTLSYADGKTRASNSGTVVMPQLQSRNKSSLIQSRASNDFWVEKLYYSGGFGYILNEIYWGEELLWQKALNRFIIAEES